MTPGSQYVFQCMLKVLVDDWVEDRTWKPLFYGRGMVQGYRKPKEVIIRLLPSPCLMLLFLFILFWTHESHSE